MSDRVSESRGSHACPRDARQSPATKSEAGNPRRRRSSLRQRPTSHAAAIKRLGLGQPASSWPSPSPDSRRTQAPPLSPSLEDRTHVLLAGELPTTPRTSRVLQLRLRRLHQTRLPLNPAQTVLKPALDAPINAGSSRRNPALSRRCDSEATTLAVPDGRSRVQLILPRAVNRKKSDGPLWQMTIQGNSVALPEVGLRPPSGWQLIGRVR